MVYSPFFNVFTCDGVGMRLVGGGLNRMMYIDIHDIVLQKVVGLVSHD